MSNPRERIDDDAYEAANDAYPGDDQVVPDDNTAADGMQAQSGKMNNSDAQLRRDEEEAIDSRNIMGKVGEGVKTRGVKKSYREPGDEEGLPGRGDSGSSSLRTGDI
ncbi:hypothetical protein BDD12DRAFT_982429 [Trichophaea hybrida]|nr:hypothetical protein BDD12DRAFT_982429 [Trichophaea hybrida]